MIRARAAVAAALVVSSYAASSSAQGPTGAPPPEAKAIVEGPKGTDEPKIEKKVDGTSVSVSAGGLLTTGNSRLLALSGNGVFETRFHDNGIGVSLLGNYGQGAPAGAPVQVTAENV